MDRTIIHVMRHGEVANPDGVLYGRLPGFGLTELGHQMAARAAQYLVESGADIARVISSPLLRAQLTAAPTAAAYGLSIASDPRLIESDNVFEGLPVNSHRAMRVDREPLEHVVGFDEAGIRGDAQPVGGCGRRRRQLCAQQRRGDDASDIRTRFHQVLCGARGHLMPELRQPKTGKPAVQDAVGVGHFAVAHDVNDGAVHKPQV